MITVGGAIDVTFSVHGAAFGDTVRLGDFSARRQASTDVTDVITGLVPSKKRGGGSGDNSVTIQFTAPSGGVSV